MVIQLKAPREMLEVLIRRSKRNGDRKDVLAKRSPDEIPRADDFIDLLLVYASLQPREDLQNIPPYPFWEKLEDICLDEAYGLRKFFKYMHKFWRGKGTQPLFKSYSYMLGFCNFSNLDELFNAPAGPWTRHYRKYLDFTLFPALN